MTDYLGREIIVGDTIVYANRRGSSLWMSCAKIVALPEGTKHMRVQRFTTLGRRFTTLTDPSRVVVTAREGQLCRF